MYILSTFSVQKNISPLASNSLGSRTSRKIGGSSLNMFVVISLFNRMSSHTVCVLWVTLFTSGINTLRQSRSVMYINNIPAATNIVNRNRLLVCHACTILFMSIKFIVLIVLSVSMLFLCKNSVMWQNVANYFYFFFNNSCSLNISSRYCAASINSILSAASCINRLVRSMLFLSCSALIYSTTGSQAIATGAVSSE